MKKYHETADGKFIAVKDLTDDHLMNIIKMIERKANEGVTIIRGGGHGDHEEMWADIEELYGEEVLEHFDHVKYKKEQDRRHKDSVKTNGKQMEKKLSRDELIELLRYNLKIDLDLNFKPDPFNGTQTPSLTVKLIMEGMDGKNIQLCEDTVTLPK